MEKTLSLLLLLSIICFKASSQELLNANKSQIKKYASTVEGVLKVDQIETGFTENAP